MPARLFSLPAAARWAACLLVFGLLVAPALAQNIDRDALRQQVKQDMHGTDGQGKDGPLAKVGASLSTLYRAHQQHQKSSTAQPFRPTQSLLRVADGYVIVDAVAARSPEALRADLEALGLRGGAVAGNLVSGRLPISSIDDMAALSSLQAARPTRAITRSGLTTSQGDAAMRADVARDELSVAGATVTVGALSDSYNTNPDASTTATQDIQSGDLPPARRIDILEDLGDDPGEPSGSDEGRAMMQIIHDVAPAADLAFHTAFLGEAQFAQGIRDLADAGAQVIVDDVLFFAEPMFQDGVIAQAATDVTLAGASYLSSAGNSGTNSYEAPFRDSGLPGVLSNQATLHDFGGGDTGQEISIPEGDSISIAFQWTDPFRSAGGRGASSDVDIFLLDEGGTVVAKSERGNIGSDPFESLSFVNDGETDGNNDGTPDERYELGIELFEGPAPALVKYVYFPSPGVAINDFDTRSPTLYGHANAAGAVATGAVFWFATPAFSDQFTNPFEVNDFSARGGVPIFFDPQGNPLPVPDVREKPELVGPDGGNTTFFGQSLNDGDNFPNFFGTSAAAPHVAAVVALMREFDPGRSPAQIVDDLQATAIDMDDPGTAGFDEGFDAATGFGLVQADEAIPLAAEVSQFTAALGSSGSRVQLSWREGGSADIAEYVIERRFFDEPFEPVATIPSNGTGEGFTTFDFETDALGLGQYTFRLRWRRPDGTEQTSPVEPTITVDLLAFEASVSGENAIALNWSVPPATRDFSYTVLRLRPDGPPDTLATTAQTSFAAEDLRPGQYEFQLRMVDDAGNALNSRTAEGTIPLDGAVALSEAYPNPFRSRFQFSVTVDATQIVDIRVYNSLGQLVQYQFEEARTLQPTVFTLDGSDWASGSYFIQLKGNDFEETRSVVRIR